ncbi:MAG TPA: dTDP-4-dehydrorhamnose 3,5-epimerase [Desulfobacteria bacterium]|nr:dTDP-4-dehydrorhamnose 3,5-epimerase [Desulfobacteria bacterium]
MKVYRSKLSEVLIIEPKIFSDARGFFVETWHQRRYGESGLPYLFVQDNLSFSTKGVIRGLHFQKPNSQGKLVSVLMGEIFDVAVDIRIGSPSFGHWVGIVLSDSNNRQLFIPEGFAHGFCVLGEEALVSYKCTNEYDSEAEGGVRWNDPDLNIGWPVNKPSLSDKDNNWPKLADVPEERLPQYNGETHEK